jgi:ABC-type uncharacterized transport system involved in gliding motility auxiliary subunit
MIAGTDAVRILLDAPTRGLGSFLRSTAGVWFRYDTCADGILELNHLVFFAAWTIVFLHLNTLFIALRRIAGSWPRMVAAGVLGLGCGMMTSHLVAEGSLARADLTEGKQRTLSPATIAILSEARVPVQVKYYVSPPDDMPSQVKSLEREVVAALTELQIASHGKLRFQVLHMNAENLKVTPEEEAADEENPGAPPQQGADGQPANDKTKRDAAKKAAAERAKSIEQRLLDKGVRPFQVSNVEATQMSAKLVYSTLGVAYRERDEEFITIDLNGLAQMEYLLANTIARVTRPRPPKIALVTGEEPMDPQMKMLLRQQGQRIPDPFTQIGQLLDQEKYDVEKVDLTAQEPMPEDYDALVVVAPNALDERQKWEIGRALREGRPTLLALQPFAWDYRQDRAGLVVTTRENDCGLDELLAANGLGVSKLVLMDENSQGLPVGGMYLSLPMHIVVTRKSMNQESELTRRLGGLLYPWGSSLELDNAKMSAAGLKRTVLLSSSEKAWLVPAPARGLSNKEIDPDGKELKPRLLAVMVEGQLADPMEGKPRPKWTPKMEMGPDGRPIPAMPDRPETPAKPAAGKLILTGCGRMWQDRILGMAQGNPAFLLNCIDALTLNDKILEVRAKQQIDRSFEKPSTATAVFWNAMTLVIVPLAVIAVGVAIAVLRFRRREQWDSAHGRWES